MVSKQVAWVGELTHVFARVGIVDLAQGVAARHTIDDDLAIARREQLRKNSRNRGRGEWASRGRSRVQANLRAVGIRARTKQNLLKFTTTIRIAEVA